MQVFCRRHLGRRAGEQQISPGWFAERNRHRAGKGGSDNQNGIEKWLHRNAFEGQRTCPLYAPKVSGSFTDRTISGQRQAPSACTYSNGGPWRKAAQL